MIFKKITTGFVVQTYDTDKQEFTSQEFIAGESTWENKDGEGVSFTKNPVLNFDMVQPKHTPVRSTATLDTFKVGDQVMVMPSDEPNDEVTHEFCGRVVNVDDMYYTVQDQYWNCFDCWPTQVYGIDWRAWQ